MRRIVRWAVVILAGFLVTHGARAGDCPSCNNGCACRQILGPDEMPCRLPGRWKITLCILIDCPDIGHTWLRYQNLDTGEVHTVGRYMKGRGGDECTPAAPVSGTIYDIDLKRESTLYCPDVYRISCLVNDPIVYKGANCGWGHGGVRNNCVTHCRDGWCYFTHEYYPLGHFIHSPKELLRELAKQHPEIMQGH